MRTLREVYDRTGTDHYLFSPTLIPLDPSPPINTEMNGVGYLGGESGFKRVTVSVVNPICWQRDDMGPGYGRWHLSLPGAFHEILARRDGQLPGEVTLLAIGIPLLRLGDGSYPVMDRPFWETDFHLPVLDISDLPPRVQVYQFAIFISLEGLQIGLPDLEDMLGTLLENEDPARLWTLDDIYDPDWEKRYLTGLIPALT